MSFHIVSSCSVLVVNSDVRKWTHGYTIIGIIVDNVHHLVEGVVAPTTLVPAECPIRWQMWQTNHLRVLTDHLARSVSEQHELIDYSAHHAIGQMSCRQLHIYRTYSVSDNYIRQVLTHAIAVQQEHAMCTTITST